MAQKTAEELRNMSIREMDWDDFMTYTTLICSDEEHRERSKWDDWNYEYSCWQSDLDEYKSRFK